MNILACEHWDRALQSEKYRVLFIVILCVLRENKKTECIDYKSHLGIFQQNIFI